MAVSLSFIQKAMTTCLLAFALIFVPGENWFGSSTANAQNLIERVLSGNAKKTTPQKRTKKKRNTKQQQSKEQSAPTTAIPIPTPAPGREEVSSQKPTSPPTPTPEPAPTPADTAPVPEKKPEQSTQPAKPAVEQPEPKKSERIYQVSCPALMEGEVQGTLSPPINDGPQCSAQSPLSLTAIGKTRPLKFANPVTTNCAMAFTLAKWSTDVSGAASKVYGDSVKITEIGTGSDYQCRNVNGASEGRVSEHAFANALDIMSFKFSDGSKTELESGWNGSEKEKAFWRAVHDASCKLFMTVIGPDGDAAHLTNMHLDQGCHGKSCLARICQ
ncbi:extensin-like domain-containing protein [Brucella thiophenivorans]|uniref:extensin-like domain-containing protein n=1 Tax=Brucella thiophenivorans TaxID=571255 RepID=UPI001F18F59F|nr:extensin family protein [Brucella thiophenivorans]